MHYKRKPTFPPKFLINKGQLLLLTKMLWSFCNNMLNYGWTNVKFQLRLRAENYPEYSPCCVPEIR